MELGFFMAVELVFKRLDLCLDALGLSRCAAHVSGRAQVFQRLDVLAWHAVQLRTRDKIADRSRVYGLAARERF